MDWQTIITSVLTSLISSSLITAGIIYVLKKSFDNAIDFRFEKLLEQQRANIQEEARRDASLYDDQYNALKQAVSLTYRLRNSAREIASRFSTDTILEKDILKTIKEFEEKHLEIRELLYKERAILPPFLFELIHELNNKVNNMDVVILAHLERKKKSGAKLNMEQFRIEVSEIFGEIDEIYSALVLGSQSQMKVIQKRDIPAKVRSSI